MSWRDEVLKMFDSRVFGHEVEHLGGGGDHEGVAWGVASGPELTAMMN
jgi:hypothetical protein